MQLLRNVSFGSPVQHCSGTRFFVSHRCISFAAFQAFFLTGIRTLQVPQCHDVEVHICQANIPFWINVEMKANICEANGTQCLLFGPLF